MDNIERRQKGLAYISDENVMAQQKVTRVKNQEFNTMDRSDFEALSKKIYDILGKAGSNAFVNPPFYCDYGFNIEVGDNFYANYNLTVLDVAKVTIGNNCFIAPNVNIFTAGHPIHPLGRNKLYEYGRPVTIGDNVWIGGNTTICPNVHIGSNVVIGAGSVVTKDIPDWCVAAGNPSRVLRAITDEDKEYLFGDEKFDDEVLRKILE